MSDDVYAKLRWSAMQSALLLLCVQDFAASILRYTLNLTPLNDEALAEIKAACVLNLKNTSTSGVSINEEAALIGQTIEKFENCIKFIIQKASEI
ncbi:hypothetical protein [Acidisphaera rubrifaciens]|nr:hypothetical protein [Acidisphaera rubrifaciens]